MSPEEKLEAININPAIGVNYSALEKESVCHVLSCRSEEGY